MHISEYLDTSLLRDHLNNGLVEVRYHKSLPLHIYTFSKKTVFENAWDVVTEKCRGLIVDDSGFIVARPFEKFFNLNTDFRPETLIQNLPETEPIILDKLDGSLGILYQQDGVSGIATKGSFHAATPKAILEALTTGNYALVEEWMYSTTASPLVDWVQDWVCKFNAEYGQVLITSTRLYNAASFEAVLLDGGRKTFAEYVKSQNNRLAPVCFAMLDGKDHSKVIWKLVEQTFENEVSKPFAIEAECEPVH